MTYLVTGGAGFIGSNFVRYLMQSDPAASVIVLDSLSYAGRLANLADVLPPKCVFKPEPHGEAARIDFDDRGTMRAAFPVEETLGRWKERLEGWSPVSLPRDTLEHAVTELHRTGRSRIAFVIGNCIDQAVTDQLVPLVDHVVNFAAETHVDRSLRNAERFLIGNVLGAHALLESTRGRRNVRSFLHVSTDEVYGPQGHGACTEESPLRPRNPYAASKAAADHLVGAYHATYGLPAIIARPSNNFGPYQYPEKLIPLMIIRALADQPLPVYGDGCQVRNWLFVEDTCAALRLLAERGTSGETYNIAGGHECRNLDVVRTILAALGKDDHLIRHVPDRLGHDRRYGIDDAKVRGLGFLPAGTFAERLGATISWYVQHRSWWQPLVLDAEYRDFASEGDGHPDREARR